MKRIIHIVTERHLATDEAFREYCQYLPFIGVPPMVAGELWKYGRAQYTNHDPDGDVTTTYNVVEES